MFNADWSFYGNVSEGNNVISWLGQGWNKLDRFSDSSTTLILENDGYGEKYFAGELFADYSGNDFRPAAGSMAIGFADPDHAPADDASGNPRDADPDAGYLEFGHTKITVTPFRSRGLRLAIPNPLPLRELHRLPEHTVLLRTDGRRISPDRAQSGGIYFLLNRGRVEKRTVTP